MEQRNLDPTNPYKPLRKARESKGRKQDRYNIVIKNRDSSPLTINKTQKNIVVNTLLKKQTMKPSVQSK